MDKLVIQRLYEALANITSDALATREGVREGLSCEWASVNQARDLLDEVYRDFETPRFWPRNRRYS